MKTSCLLIFLFTSISLYGQINGGYFPLHTINPNEDFSDLAQIDSIFDNRKVIGVGESTHGTSEFTTYRHRLFKYLVENKGFNVFFLEADVNACQRVNRYINGSDDNGKEVLLEVKLWPWLTEELLTMIEWMRKHNETAEKKIQFVGCDMQLIQDDELELSRILSDSISVKAIFGQLKYPYKDTLIVKSSYNKWYALKDSIKVSQTVGVDSLPFKLIDISIEQWYQHKLSNGIKYNYRDSCMAVNIMHYLSLYPNSKGMYFAHNGHVAKSIYEYPTKFYYSRKMAGFYLSEALGSEYLCIGQTTETGTFNALTYANEGYEFKIHDLKKVKNKTLEKYLVELNQTILISNLDELEDSGSLMYTEIGAIYDKSLEGFKVKRYRSFSTSRYDYFIFIKNTTETKLLKKPKITGKSDE